MIDIVSWNGSIAVKVQTGMHTCCVGLSELL